jgi:hypothetical protein
LCISSEREQGHGLGQPVLAGERLVEVEATSAPKQIAQQGQPPFE